MFGLTTATRIFVAPGATDMRKGFDGLFGVHGPEALTDRFAASSVGGQNMDHDSFFVHIDAAAAAVVKNRRFPEHGLLLKCR
jgi:hypothetical protein